MVHSVGAPLAVLTIDPEANPTVLNVTLHPNGLVPYDGAPNAGIPPPVDTEEYVPMSAADPDRAQQHHDAAHADPSLAWMSRFLDLRPGYMVIAPPARDR